MGFDNECCSEQKNRGVENLDGLGRCGFESKKCKHECLKSGLAQSMKGINCLTQSLGSDASLNQLLTN